MPTGYTSKLYDGNQEFSDFALHCAREFLIEIRDSLTTPDNIEPNPFYGEKYEEALARLEEVTAWTFEEAKERAEQRYFEHVLKIDVAIEEMEQLKGRYSDMLLRVQEWSPPTPDHRGLKLFMLEQLSKSIENDCDTLQYQYPKFPDDPLSYKDQEIENAKSDIAYYGRKMLEESKRATESTAWLAKLRESLI